MQHVELSVGASPARRSFAVLVVYALGALLVYLAFAAPPSLGYLILLLVLGFGALVAGEALRRASRARLVLGQDGLALSTGRMLARFEDIASVSRGAFAMKPSSGFVLVLKERGPFAYAPGMYWRMGKRLGVGGVLPQRETRAIAEAIALRIASQPTG